MKKRKQKKKRRVITRALVVGGLVVVGGVGVGVLILSYTITTLPSPELIANPVIAESTKIYDRTGEFLLYEIHGPEKRTVIAFNQIPEFAKQAALSIEDAGFYTHAAFDWRSIARAFLKNLRAGEITQGGSTITQQLAKNTFLTTEQTYTRKIKELALAWELEKQFSKDEILNLYLNQIPYGSNIYGIESASNAYFAKSAEDLSLAESAILASLPKAPTYFSPWGSRVEELHIRKNLVLEQMIKQGYITEEEGQEAMGEEIEFAPPETSIRAPHFVTAVQEYLNNRYGEDFVRTAGLKVTTTLDWGLQQVAEEVVKEGAERNEELYKGENAALVAEDPRTGQIIAMVGSRDYFDTERDGNFNVVTQGLRQPGSAMKPFVYLSAFLQGYTPDTILFDVETEFDTTGDKEKSYKPGNFDGIFRGPVTMRTALAQSINVPAVKTLYLTGIDNVLNLLKKLGITTLGDRTRFGLSLVLGGGEIKLIELVNAYATLSQNGMYRPVTMVLRVESKDRVLETFQDNPTQVIEENTARQISAILSDVEERAGLFQGSLGLTLFPGREVAMKTGTTNDYRDAWTFGYTPSLVVGVWAGNNNNTPMQQRGGSILAAVPMWSKFMNEAVQKYPKESFSAPGLVLVQKPVLKGEHIITYTKDGSFFPQIHNILFYVNKRTPGGSDPSHPIQDVQFMNWEAPTLAWVRNALPGIDFYNAPLPFGSIPLQSSFISLSPLTIEWNNPKNGAFIDTSFEVDAEIASQVGIEKIELFLNNSLIDTKVNIASNPYRYRSVISISQMKLQNLLVLKAINNEGLVIERKIIVFKNS